MELELAVKIAIIFSGIFLWIGMFTGVWKYWQIRQSPQSRAHYYVDIAHRSSLLYAPATLILAVLAYCSVWPSMVNLICVLINILFSAFLLGLICCMVSCKTRRISLNNRISWVSFICQEV